MVKKAWRQISVISLVVLLLAGCGSPSSSPEPTSPPPPIPTQLPQPTPTLAPTAVTVAIVAEPTEEPATTLPVCAGLADELTQVMGVPATAVDAPFQDWHSGETFDGCQASATATGQRFEDVIVFSDTMTGMMARLGWTQDEGYMGGGPGATLVGFRQNDQLCLMTAAGVPASDDLCADDEPIFVCWEQLTPEQKHYDATIYCTEEGPAVIAPSSEPVRIEFAPGTTSSQVRGYLPPGSLDQYVLSARANQDMSVNLIGPASVEAILVIWGADGTVLISDHASASAWQGMLPLTQDYYIDVRSVAADTLDYTLEIVILPE